MTPRSSLGAVRVGNFSQHSASLERGRAKRELSVELCNVQGEFFILAAVTLVCGFREGSRSVSRPRREKGGDPRGLGGRDLRGWGVGWAPPATTKARRCTSGAAETASEPERWGRLIVRRRS